MKQKTVVVGMSGGVDSSVCALLLKQQGYKVIGVFMQNWDTFLNNDVLGHTNKHETSCNVYQDFSDVQSVGEQLGIEVHKVNFERQYWNKVFKYVINSYRNGTTPNPDILCNKFIKFGNFLTYVKNKFHCDKVAMGHYAAIKKSRNKYFLQTCADKQKDQTYFLSYLNQKQLSNTLFPLAKLTKQEVRQIANENKLCNWNKKDSTGVCFIGERKFKHFLSNYIKPKVGKVIDICTNKIIGQHDGAYFYTYGQNSRLGLSGQTKKYYVCKKDIKNNILFVCDNQSKDKYLSSSQCELSNFNWVSGIPKNHRVKIKFRYQQQPITGKFIVSNNKVIVTYKKTLAITPGQFAVFYQNKICLGGGVVNKLLK